MKNRKLFGLQLFAEAIAGKKVVYLYRILSTEKDHDATALAFTTENERTKSKDADSTATKDGAVRTPGTAEGEITASSLLKKGDTFIDELEEALDNDEKMEIWQSHRQVRAVSLKQDISRDILQNLIRHQVLKTT